MIKLTATEMRKVEKIRMAMLRDLGGVLRQIDSSLGDDVQAMVKKLGRSKWRKADIKKHVSALMDKHYGRAERESLRLVEDASLYAQDYARRIVELAPQNYTAIPPSQVQWLTKQSLGNVKAATSLVRGKSAGAKSLYKGKLKLSKRFHSLADEQARKVSAMVVRSIRESQSVGFASRDIVNAVKLGQRDKLPKLLQDLRKSATRLNSLTDGALKNELVKIKKYMRRINEGGRVGGAYQELVQSLSASKGRPGPAVEKAIARWTHHKQRYYAERIIETETNAAFRASTIDETARNEALVGYIWMLNRSGDRSIGCACEQLDGQSLKVEEARRLQGGAHPFCSCSLDPIFDKEKLLS